MIKLIVNRGVYCKNLPDEAKRKIISNLSFDNPQYENAMKHGKNVSSNTPKKIPFFEASKKTYWIPRGYIYYLTNWLRENNYKFIIEDRTTTYHPLRIKFYGEMWDYQEPAIMDMLNYPVGTLEADTGAGKTVIGCKMIAERKQPTLILVHTKVLLRNWKKAIKKFLHYNCGIIGDGEYNVKHVTVGIINSVKTHMHELDNRFGQIICDEVHRCASTMWSESLQEFTAKYFLGLTATPFRQDGLGKAIFACVGPILHTVDRKQLKDKKAVLVPEIRRLYSQFYFMYTGNYHEMMQNMIKDKRRNKLICTKIRSELRLYKEKILVVSDRAKHCAIIHKMLLNMNIKSVILTGQISDKQRRVNSDIIDDGDFEVLVATTSLIGEGFDAPDLAGLFLCSPMKYSGRLFQIIGRILRKRKNKTPRVWDIRDNKIYPLAKSGRLRDKIYAKRWGRHCIKY